MRDKKSGGLGETLRTVLYAVLIAFAVRTFAYEPFNIPSGSMIPTLLEGDYLFVSKFSYGYSWHTLPLSFVSPLFQGRVFGSMPERGDVVVFKLPTDPSTDYIKRIVGLPGDRLQVRNGILHINGEPVQRRRLEDFVTADRFGRVARVPRYEETLPGGATHEILEFEDNGGLDNTRVYDVPEGHYFVMGDNRDRSQDSRVLSAVGYVPLENLAGRAEFLWFSLDDAHFLQLWRWPSALRFDRLFTGID